MSGDDDAGGTPHRIAGRHLVGGVTDGRGAGGRGRHAWPATGQQPVGNGGAGCAAIAQISSAPAAVGSDLLDQALERLVDFYETLEPRSLCRLGELYAPGASFKDPFNEVSGVPAIERIFRHMFAQVADPRFVVTTRLRDGGHAMLVWTFAFGLEPRRITVCGVSHLVFDAHGRVVRHRDYWDPAEELYARLPLIGPLMRWLRRRFSAS